jgi:hypothetical protein
MTFFFFPTFFFNPRGISVGAFSGVENAKMWGLSPEMPKTGSPLAKGGLSTARGSSIDTTIIFIVLPCGKALYQWDIVYGQSGHK